MILIFILYTIFALTFILGKASNYLINPLLLIALRMLIAGSILMIYCQAKKLKLPNFKNALILSTWHIAIPYCLEFIAFKYSSATIVAFIFNLSPLITGIIERLLYQKRLSILQWTAILIGFLATIIASINEISWSCLDKNYDLVANYKNLICLKNIGFGELLVFIAVISSAWAWLYISKLTKQGYTIAAINAPAMLGGGLMAFAAFFVAGNSLTAQLNWESWKMVIALLVLGNLIGYNLYGSLLKRYSATFLALCGSMTPLLVALLEWLIFAQVPTLNLLIASFIIAIAIKMFLYKAN